MASRPPSLRRVFVQKHFDLPGLVMFGHYRQAASYSGLAPHAHRNAIEICFLERGEQTYRVGGRLYRLRGNDQFFTLPGEIHDTADLPQERGVLYWLILDLGSSPHFLGLAKTPADRLKQALRSMPTRHFRGHPECGPILGQIMKTLAKKPSAYSRLRLQSLLLHYLTQTLEASRRGAHGFASPLMQRVLSHIKSHLTDPVEVPRLAEVARLSESRFKIRFKEEIGVPPAEYWLRQKIERASLRLKTRSVTEVAFELGFSSSQYFATVFKRYTLINPSQYTASALDKPTIPFHEPRHP